MRLYCTDVNYKKGRGRTKRRGRGGVKGLHKGRGLNEREVMLLTKNREV